MRALVTGISGFAGSHLAEYLLSHTDWAIAGTVYGPVNNGAHTQDRLAVYPADLSQSAVFGDFLKETRPDYIFHLTER